MNTSFHIRDLAREEIEPFGEMLVSVYSALEGFPRIDEQPAYYELLRRAGEFTARRGVRVLVAVGEGGELLGGVVYFGDMAEYGSGGSAPELRNASGLRLLAVAPQARGQGVGKALTQACIELARAAAQAEVVLHTTRAMQTAWSMYEAMGFRRAAELDFDQSGLPVFGFRLRLATAPSTANTTATATATALRAMLVSLQPRLHPQIHAYCSQPSFEAACQLPALALFREDEGITVVIAASEAERLGLEIHFRAAWITLGVDSQLEGIGLTAAVARVLADRGIACNVIAALHHDHLFVPEQLASDAMDALRELQYAANAVRDDPVAEVATSVGTFCAR